MKKLQAIVKSTGKTYKYTILLPNGQEVSFGTKRDYIEAVQLQFNKDGSIDLISKGKLSTAEKGVNEHYKAIRENEYYANKYGKNIEKHEAALLTYVEEFEQEETKSVEEKQEEKAKPAKIKTVIISCEDCNAEREIKVQDVFQVKRCKECQKKHRNKMAAERRRLKRAEAKKEA